MICKFFLALVLAASAISVEAGAQPSQEKHKPAKPAHSRKVNPCAQYGPGFVQVAGTNTCIKVGGAVGVEGGR
jgi:hypothetical protein